MPTNLIITVISDDKPGVVEVLADTIRLHQGNWLESRLTQLAGKFAGVIRVQVESTHTEALQASLSALSSKGIKTIVG